MPFLAISYDGDVLGEEAYPEAYIALRDEIVAAVSAQLSFTMPLGSSNTVTVTATDFQVTIHRIDRSIGEYQAKRVELKIEAIGYPDRMRKQYEKANLIRTVLEKLYPDLTFGVWLDLKPDAVWSE